MITHKELSEATIDRHREEQGCTKAIAIAREYATEGRQGKESALIRETKGKVPLITTEGIAELLRLHEKRPFTYDKVELILTTWTHPRDCVLFIRKTWEEMPDLGLMKLILTVAYELVQKESVNLPDPGMILADERVRKRKIKKEELITILQAIQLTTNMILIRDTKDYRFELLAPPETIIRALSMDSVKTDEKGTASEASH